MGGSHKVRLYIQNVNRFLRDLLVRISVSTELIGNSSLVVTRNKRLSYIIHLNTTISVHSLDSMVFLKILAWLPLDSGSMV